MKMLLQSIIMTYLTCLESLCDWLDWINNSDSSDDDDDTSQSHLIYGDSTDEVHEGSLELCTNNLLCIMCWVPSVMQSLSLDLIAGSPKIGDKPVHNLPWAVH
jgi:hypothetical protein